MRTDDVMTADPVTIGPQELLRSAAEAMVAHGVSGLPVVDRDSSLVGIITEADFVHREAQRAPSRRHRVLAAVLGRGESLRDETADVGSAMTTDVVTIGPDKNLAEAARTMERHRVKRLPVVDDNGQLVGIVSRADLMRAFIQPDHDIEEVIRVDLVQGVLFTDPATIEVSAREGFVTLAGTLDTKGEAELLHQLVLRENGVTGVDSRLKWRVDEETGEWS